MRRQEQRYEREFEQQQEADAARLPGDEQRETGRR